MHYLYRITNKINGKVYIGQTINPGARRRQHKQKSSNPYLRSSIQKYGWDNFEFECISACISQESANESEEELIIQYDSRNPEKGYNIGSSDIYKKSDEWRKHLSEITKKRFEENPQYKEKLLDANKQYKEKLKENNEIHPGTFQKGHEVKSEWKKRMQLANLGRKQSQEEIEKRRKAVMNNTLTEKQVEEIRELYQNNPNITVKELSEKYQVNHNTIKKRLFDLKIRNNGQFKKGQKQSTEIINLQVQQRMKNTLSEEQVKQIRDLYQQDTAITIAKLSKMFNVDAETIRRRIDDLPIRNNGEFKKGVSVSPSTQFKKGQSSHNRRFNDEQEKQIFLQFKNGQSKHSLSREYKIDRTCITRIINKYSETK